MKEALFILAVIVIILAYTAFRNRKFILAVIQMIRIFRSPESLKRAAPGEVGGNDRISGGNLVKCESCGVRIPQNRAMQMDKGRYFCSNSCVAINSRKK